VAFEAAHRAGITQSRGEFDEAVARQPVEVGEAAILSGPVGVRHPAASSIVA